MTLKTDAIFCGRKIGYLRTDIRWHTTWWRVVTMGRLNRILRKWPYVIRAKGRKVMRNDE